MDINIARVEACVERSNFRRTHGGKEEPKEDLNPPECGKCCKIMRIRKEQKRCGRCRIAWYCSKKCQADDWLRHKKMCKPVYD